MSSVELKCDARTLAEVCVRLKVDNLEHLFRLEGSQVVVELQLDKTYMSLNRTFSVFATVFVDGNESKWLLGFDHPCVYLQQVTVIKEKRKNKRGPREFSQLAIRFQEAKFTHVDTEGVRSPARKSNPKATEYGYNALPKWGFDGPIPESSKADLSESHSEMTTIRQLLDTEGGKTVWEEVGETCVLRFDLALESESWPILADYLGQTLEQIQSN